MSEAGEDKAGFNELNALLREKGSFWHRTSLLGLKGILTANALQPNAGSFGYSYPQSKSSYASALKAVALFDFDEPTDDAIADRAYAWEPFIFGKLPGVLIRLDRAALDKSLLILPSEIWANDYRLSPLQDRAKLTIIPDMEALYIGPISAGAFSRLILLDHGGGGNYRFEQFNVSAAERLVQLGAQWAAEHEAEEKTRREAGELSLADLTMEIAKGS
jgi:hypothetical protein